MATFAKEILELIQALEGLRMGSYVDMGSFAILVYDYMLTFEDERTLMWNSPWSLPKVLFLMTRYLPFVDLSITASHHFRSNMTPEACSLAYKSAGWLINIGIIVAELILAVRTLAIWGHDQRIKIAIIVWSIANFAADVVIMVLFLRSISFTQLPGNLLGCLVTSGNTLIYGVWITLMVYEAGNAGIITLMIIRGIKIYSDKDLRSSLINAVFRHGAIFYVYIFTLSVANLIVISRLSRDLSTMLASIERVTHACLTGRLLLTLRAVANEGQTNQPSYIESMVFEEKRKGPVDSEAGTGTHMSELRTVRTEHCEEAGPSFSQSVSVTSVH